MLGQERPISWLERLKIACCEPSEGGYVTDDNDEIVFKNRSDAALSGPRQRPPLVRGIGKGARGGGALCPEKDERATFPATLALPKSPAMLEHTVTLEHDYAEGVDLNLPSARTDVTMASPFLEAAPSAVWDTIPTSEEKTPLADGVLQRRPVPGAAIAPRGSYSGPSGHPGNPTRWTDAVVEGFLYSTLVDGSGLVLTKLSADGKHRDMGERIVFYDPKDMKLNWISTGIRRKPGGALAKDITEVNREGTIVTIVYFAAPPPVPIMRRRRLSPLRLTTTTGTKRKIFQTEKERDAKILREVLLLVQRKAVQVSFKTTTSDGRGAGK